MKLLSRLLGGLWAFSKTTSLGVVPGLRAGSGASALAGFLFLVFFLVGGVALLLGYDLNTVDRWLDRQTNWLDALGSLLFRLLCGAILLLCVAGVAGGVYQKIAGGKPRSPDEERDAIGWGGIVTCAVIGYFAWFGVKG